MLPSAKQITSAAEGLFMLEDWHSFGPHYDYTLMAWHSNFRKTGTKSKTLMMKDSIECGLTIFFPVQAVSGSEGINCGRLCFQKMV